MLESLNVHWLTQLVMTSGLLVLFVARAFSDNATSRRIMAVLVMALLMILPFALWFLKDVFWHLGVENPWDLMPLWQRKIPSLALMAWAAGSVVFLSMVSYQVVRNVKAIHRLPVIDQAFDRRSKSHARPQLSTLAARVLPGYGVTLRLGGQREPCSTSLGAKTLILPDAYRTWSLTTLDAVLVHELIHLSRGDSKKLFLMHLLRALYWWMPWMGTLSRELVQAMEESCDDEAAEILGSSSEYLKGLADVARQGLQATPLGFESMAGVHLNHRFRRFLLQRKQQLDSNRVYWGLIGILLLVLLITGVNPVAPSKPSVPVVPLTLTEPVHARSENLSEKRGAGATTYPVVVVSADSALFAPSPIYPGSALNARIEGSVVVEYFVTRDGSVVRSRIIQSTPPGVFDRAVLNALARYRYPSQPARASPGERERLRKQFHFSIRRWI